MRRCEIIYFKDAMGWKWRTLATEPEQSRRRRTKAFRCSTNAYWPREPRAFNRNSNADQCTLDDSRRIAAPSLPTHERESSQSDRLAIR